MSNHLLRSSAPISDSGWSLIDAEARERLIPALAARRLVEFRGPHGWEYSASNLGRAEQLDRAPQPGVCAARRRVLALAELRADFRVARSELADHDRGAPDVDLDALAQAAHRIALAENTAVFHGWGDAGIRGIAQASPHAARSLGASADEYPRAVAGAVQQLLSSGVGGPYGLAVGREQYEIVVETAEHGGHLLLDHLTAILDGPIVWAPGVSGAVLLSLRGGDYVYDCGQDLSIGYSAHDDEYVQLYIEESFSFMAASPDAAVALTA